LDPREMPLVKQLQSVVDRAAAPKGTGSGK